MAGLIRRYALGAIALPFLFLVIARSTQAATIIVNTLESGSQPAPLCTLEDAVRAANSEGMVGGCAAGTGADSIEFIVTGTIFTDDTIIVTDPFLNILGPTFVTPPGPSPAAGVTIDGGGTHEIFDVENSGANDFLEMEALTLAHGSITTANFGAASVGGAINGEGTFLYIFNCTLSNNSALPVSHAGFGGALFNGNGTVDIVNSTFFGNHADGGGAVWDNSSTWISNVTFSGNQADLRGGGALGFDPEPLVPQPLVVGAIIANSTGGNCSEAVEDLGYSLSDDASGCFTAATSKNGVTNLNLDPSGLQNNGGPTDTLALEAGSEAIHFDNNCVDTYIGEFLNFDQRFYARADPTLCDSGAYESDGLPHIVLAPNSERVQIARSTGGTSDEVNLAFTYTDNGPGEFGEPCDIGNSPLPNGVFVNLAKGTCDALISLGLPLPLGPFKVQTVKHQSYGSLFAELSPEPGTVSARIVQLKTPVNACGEFTLNIEVAGINTATYGLTGTNPFALIITDGNDNSGCFDITNAVAGNQIPPPIIPVIRRAVRR